MTEYRAHFIHFILRSKTDQYIFFDHQPTWGMSQKGFALSGPEFIHRWGTGDLVKRATLALAFCWPALQIASSQRLSIKPAEWASTDSSFQRRWLIVSPLRYAAGSPRSARGFHCLFEPRKIALDQSSKPRQHLLEFSSGRRILVALCLRWSGGRHSLIRDNSSDSFKD